jgi:hypothetical protein
LRQARLLVRAALSIVERSPLLKGFIESASEDELRFTNGTAIAAFPCSSRGGRGWPISCLVLDEAAHHIDSEGNVAAERIWNALVPSTAQFGDASRVIVASTPYGTDGFFAELWAKADSGEVPDAIPQQHSTEEVNPTIDQAFLERERARDPESFRSEYLAAFVGSGAAYLDAERVDAAVAPRAELTPDEVIDTVAGFDPAFSHDPAGLVIIGRDRHRPIGLVVALARAWAPERHTSFEDRREREDIVLAEVAQVCRRYRVGKVCTDQFSALAVVNRLERAGLYVESNALTAPSKTAAFAEVRALLYSGGLELYQHPDLIAELKRLRSKFTAGSAAVVNPRVGGSHGDLAMALALAIYQDGESSLDPPFALQTVPPAPVDEGDAYDHYRDSPIDSWSIGW